MLRIRWPLNSQLTPSGGKNSVKSKVNIEHIFIKWRKTAPNESCLLLVSYTSNRYIRDNKSALFTTCFHLRSKTENVVTNNYCSVLGLWNLSIKRQNRKACFISVATKTFIFILNVLICTSWHQTTGKHTSKRKHPVFAVWSVIHMATTSTVHPSCKHSVYWSKLG